MVVLVYEWQAWQGFLISHLVDENNRLSARYEDTSSTIMEAAAALGARAVLLQINLTLCQEFPQDRRQVLDELRGVGLDVWNRSVGDISKRNLHRILRAARLPCAAAEQQGDPEERVFVKSNLNWGGEVESRFSFTRTERFGVAARGSPINRFDEYFMTTRKLVDATLWSDRSVVIERYICNSKDTFFRVYRCGESVVVVKAHSAALVKKLCGNEDDLNFPLHVNDIMFGETPLPHDLREVLREFIIHTQIEYFCLDVAHDDSSYYIVDLNLTPWSGVDSENGEMIAFLRDGMRRGLANRCLSMSAT